MRRLLLTLAATLAAPGALAQQSALVGPLQPYNNLADLSVIGTGRTNLGLGTAATQNTGTSGATLPLLNGVNTWSSVQSLSADIYMTNATQNSLWFGASGLGLPGGAGDKIILYNTAFGTRSSANYSIGVNPNEIYANLGSGGLTFSAYVAGTKIGAFTTSGLLIPKLAATPATAPGAGFGFVYLSAGTNAGTCKLQVMAGTSTTPATVLDNIGSGC